VTLLYYPNAKWRLAWNGSLLFLSEDEQEVARMVPYAPNRVVLFPAAIPHYADAPSKSFPGLRISLAYKLRRDTTSLDS
jgi:Rps23 Pro-64 3,4-dihydroxylase Tpa1-like proline 4-hydroxylase